MLRTCQRCAMPFSVEKSRSSLHLTYCGLLCEVADLGFVIDEFLRLPARARRSVALPAEAQAACGSRTASRPLPETGESGR